MTKRVRMDGVGDVAASNHAVLHREQAASFGLFSGNVRRLKQRGILDEPVPGVLRFVGAPHTWHQNLAIATAAAQGQALISHRASARLHRLDGFTRDFVEVLVERGRMAHVKGIIRHQVSAPIDPEDIVVIDGIRCTSLERTLADLPSVVDDRTMERALDDYQRRGKSLGRLEQVASRLQRPGHRGPKLILEEIARRRKAGMVRGSWFEKLIEECIHSRLLPPTERQHEIRDQSGGFIARVDLAFPAVKLGIECHSRSFHTGTHAEIVDQRRENRAMLEGWQFLYLGWADRKTPAQARSFLEQVVTRRARDLGIAL